jgi:hypothetical protein
VVQKLGKISLLKLNLPLAFEVLFMFFIEVLDGEGLVQQWRKGSED